jgi:hypothetical protein
MGAPYHKLFSAMLIGALTLPFASSVLFNLVVDPFEILHKSENRPAAFLGGVGLDRYTHAGVIRHYQPNAIVIGHSHAANFLPSHVDDKLGFRNTYSLTLNGGPLFEQGRVARHALENSNIKDVLWLFNSGNLMRSFDAGNLKVPFPTFLYDKVWFNDINLFITHPMRAYTEKKAKKRKELIKLSKVEKRRLDPRDYSTAWYRMQQATFNQPIRVAQLILGQRKSYTKRATQLRLETSITKKLITSYSVRSTDYEKNLQYNILPAIVANPSTKFRIVIDPPFPLMTWQVRKIYERRDYEQHLALINRQVNDLAKYPNVEIYGFGGEPATQDLRLYKDRNHYHLKLNEMMLDKIAEGRNRLTPEKVLDYLIRFDAQVTQYKLRDEWNPESRREEMRLTKAKDLGKE